MAKWLALPRVYCTVLYKRKPDCPATTNNKKSMLHSSYPVFSNHSSSTRWRTPRKGSRYFFMVFQKELLYALLGYTGRVVVEKDGAFDLASGLPLIVESERALCRRLLELGYCYRKLDAFVKAQLFEGDNGPLSAGGAYLVAFALGIDQCLQPYRARVLELEQQLIRTPDLSLPALQLGFGDFELTLPALHRLLACIERKQLRGVALLDHLHDAVAACADSLRLALNVLLRHTQRVFRSQLSAWLLHGELLPGDGEFFVALGTGDTTDAAADETLEWSAFVVSIPHKPAAMPMRVAERILFIGKAVRVLRASERRQADARRAAHALHVARGPFLGAASATVAGFPSLPPAGAPPSAATNERSVAALAPGWLPRSPRTPAGVASPGKSPRSMGSPRQPLLSQLQLATASVADARDGLADAEVAHP